MKTWLLALLLLLPLPAWCAEARSLSADPATEQRMMALAENLRCLVCQNETLAASQADLARDLRQEIREMMRAGKSDEEITRYLTVRYGDFVLYRPQLKPLTWLLWFGPFLLLAGGLGGLYRFLKRRDKLIAEATLPDIDKGVRP